MDKNLNMKIDETRRKLDRSLSEIGSIKANKAKAKVNKAISKIKATNLLSKMKENKEQENQNSAVNGNESGEESE